MSIDLRPCFISKISHLQHCFLKNNFCYLNYNYLEFILPDKTKCAAECNKPAKVSVLMRNIVGIVIIAWWCFFIKYFFLFGLCSTWIKHIMLMFHWCSWTLSIRMKTLRRSCKNTLTTESRYTLSTRAGINPHVHTHIYLTWNKLTFIFKWT